MDRTLITPAMIETFRVCKRAFKIAYGTAAVSADRQMPSVIVKEFLLNAIGEINRGRITSVSQVQKFMGQYWPVDRLSKDVGVKAFLYTYKALTHYVSKPYRPRGAEVVGVELKVRARLPHQRTYLEDSFDLILWHPGVKRLEFVDYHLSPLKPIDPAWPSATILVKQFLAERLRSRFPFQKLVLTFIKISAREFSSTRISADQALYKLHWSDVVKSIDDMKEPQLSQEFVSCLCRRCKLLDGRNRQNVTEKKPLASKTA
jgi:hypothetical protein